MEANDFGGARVEESHGIACLFPGNSLTAIASELIKEGEMDVEIDMASLIIQAILLKVVINHVFHLDSVLPHAIELAFIVNVVFISKFATLYA